MTGCLELSELYLDGCTPSREGTATGSSEIKSPGGMYLD